MKRALLALTVMAALLFPAMSTTGQASPVFGSAKVAKLDTNQMKSVVGKNTTSAYYAYLGAFYASYAIQMGSYAAYLEAFGTTYRSDRSTYYYYAQYYAYYGYYYYYYAYYYN